MALVTQVEKQYDMILASVLLSETMVNKSADEEPTYVFFKTRYADIRNLMKRTLNAVKES
jgi:hypothetical protein